METEEEPPGKGKTKVKMSKNLQNCPCFSGKVNLLSTIALLLGLSFAFLVSIAPQASLPPSDLLEALNQSANDTSEFPAPFPRPGSLFLLYILFVGCLVAGYLVSLVKLPELLGMLLLGILVRNLPLNLWSMAEPQWTSILRRSAFVVILLQGGLGLDLPALKRLKVAVLRLSFLPCVAEALTVSVASHLILGFPWIQGLLMGFVLGAVSPAVCVPSLLKLQEQGLGVDQGIPTLVIAASSTDDVLAITGFGVLFSVAFAKGGLAWTIVRGPLDMIIGIAYGLVIGVLSWRFPAPNDDRRNLLRFLFLLLAGMVSMFGSAGVGVDGAGALGCLVAATAAAHGWSKSSTIAPVADAFAILWFCFQPFLFGLIGGEVDLLSMDAGKLGLSFVILIIGIIVRTAVAFATVFGEGFTLKEQLFIALAWLPKATVQAALGPVYYDAVVATDPSNIPELSTGIQILTMAVLGIVVTAPLGAALISLTGPLLLRKAEEPQEIPMEDSKSPLTGNHDTEGGAGEAIQIDPASLT